MVCLKFQCPPAWLRPERSLYALLMGWIALMSYGCGSSFFRTYYVASGAMEPTLQIRDRVLVAQGSYQRESPERGDIVAFRTPPEMTQAMGGEQGIFLYRVVGLPEETFEVRDGQTFIDGVPLEEPYIREPAEYVFGPVTIPQDAYVVLGDNRNNAFDSHSWGFVPHENLVGKVQTIYWPPGRYGSVD